MELWRWAAGEVKRGVCKVTEYTLGGGKAWEGGDAGLFPIQFNSIQLNAQFHNNVPIYRLSVSILLLFFFIPLIQKVLLVIVA